jgi:hypothetical protein
MEHCPTAAGANNPKLTRAGVATLSQQKCGYSNSKK